MPTTTAPPAVRRCAECDHPCTNPSAPAGWCSWKCRNYSDRDN